MSSSNQGSSTTPSSTTPSSTRPSHGKQPSVTTPSVTPPSAAGVALFSELNLSEPIQRAIKEGGYTEPTPIQRDAIPVILQGRDVLGCAQTGTGKTAAFALPILHDLMEYRPRGQKVGQRVPVRVLVLTPTRELASQIGDSFAAYGKHLPIRHTVVFGGVGQMPQVRDLRRGVEVLIATPGRLNDLIGQGHAHLRDVEVFVLDEADRMLDMGFLPQVRRIIEVLPKDRQTLFFSATMPREIGQLAKEILDNPVRVDVAPTASTAEKVEQSVFFVDKDSKRALLEHVLTDKGITRALVFTRTKHGADRVARHLEGVRVRSAAIHGNKSQGAREKALDEFKRGQVRVLVATDIAARGIDVKDVSHVINFDLPNEPESYVHRIGRTARAGREGIAMSFCDREERGFLRDIERTIRMRLDVNAAHPFHQEAPPPRAPTSFSGRGQNQGGRGQPGRGGPRHGGRDGGGGGGGFRNAAPRSDGPRGGGFYNGAPRPARGPMRPVGTGPRPTPTANA